MFEYFLLTWNNFDRNGTPYNSIVSRAIWKKITLVSFSKILIVFEKLTRACFFQTHINFSISTHPGYRNIRMNLYICPFRRGVRHDWNLVHSTQKSTEIKPEIKKSREKLVNFEITKTSLLLSPQPYMTAVTHRNQVRNQKIRSEITLEIKKSHINQQKSV
jgi:hypothetical protein